MHAVSRIVGTHHEWFDGSGYPRGLSGDRIPVGARIVALCDAFDAMTSGRPYSPRRNVDAALDELILFSGRQFDPTLVSAFLLLYARDFRISSYSEFLHSPHVR
jgi:HD-GYP domain-containing protein (c-di-GMP phosphodiesterase class II)